MLKERGEEEDQKNVIESDMSWALNILFCYKTENNISIINFSV